MDIPNWALTLFGVVATALGGGTTILGAIVYIVQRLTRLETRLDSPTQLHVEIREVSSGVKALHHRFDQIDARITRLEQHIQFREE